jgi:nicotinamide mononucleotide transporter
MSWAEVFGFLTGAVSVLLFARQRVAAWPIGIANSLFWLMLFWQSRLYFDSSLQFVYIVLGVLGWFWWVRGGPAGASLPVARTGRREAALLISLAVVGTAALWFGQARWTDGSLPFWDSSTTVVSLVAQYMLTRKRFGNWWLWIGVDVAYVAMYLSQHLFLTAALQPVFIVLCLRGVRDWRRSMTTMSSAQAAIAPIAP